MDAVYRAARITSRSDETPLAPGARPRARAAAPRPRRCLEAPARAPRAPRGGAPVRARARAACGRRAAPCRAAPAAGACLAAGLAAGLAGRRAVRAQSHAGQPDCACTGRRRCGAGVRRVPVRRRGRGGDAHGVRARVLRRVLAAAPGRADPRGPQPPARVHGRALRRGLRRGAGAAPAPCDRAAEQRRCVSARNRADGRLAAVSRSMRRPGACVPAHGAWPVTQQRAPTHVLPRIGTCMPHMPARPSGLMTWQRALRRRCGGCWQQKRGCWPGMNAACSSRTSRTTP